jgi:O-antigen ligase
MKGILRIWPVCAGPFVTLALSFGWTASTDSFKLLALGLIAGASLASLVIAFWNSVKILLTAPFLFSLVFLVGLSIPIIFSNSPFAQQIYGVSGRNLGFLHYFFLLIIFLGFTTLNFNLVWSRILKSLVITGGIEAAYGWLQFFGLDPSPWKNPDNWIIGTFGNPNYLSSFLGLSAIATIYFVLEETRVHYKFAYFLLVFFQSGIIMLSNSSQGLFLLVFGLCAQFAIIFFRKSRILGTSFLILQLAMGLVATLGIFQSGPLKKYLYQVSVSFRGDYWRAGIQMFQENWLHGVGLDSFGDYYRIFRDSVAVNRRGSDVFTNSAHNLFIDLAATGGIVLLFSYLSIIVLVIASIFRTLKFNTNIPSNYFVLIILWVAFQLQTLISINVPSLAIWGWIFSGLILTYGNPASSNSSKGKSGIRTQKVGIVVTELVCFLFCLLLVFPLISREVRLANALVRNQVPEITQSVVNFPRDADQMAGIAEAYGKIGRFSESLELAKQATKENQNSLRAWMVIYLSDVSSPTDKAWAKEKIGLLDPFLLSISD